MSEVDRLSNSGLYPALPMADRRSRKDGSAGQPPDDANAADKAPPSSGDQRATATAEIPDRRVRLRYLRPAAPTSRARPTSTLGLSAVTGFRPRSKCGDHHEQTLGYACVCRLSLHVRSRSWPRPARSMRRTYRRAREPTPAQFGPGDPRASNAKINTSSPSCMAPAHARSSLCPRGKRCRAD